MVCDDLGEEWADFIGFRTDPSAPRITFYHAKHGELSLGASPFHVSVGQAINNLGNLSFPASSMPKKYRNRGRCSRRPLLRATVLASLVILCGLHRGRGVRLRDLPRVSTLSHFKRWEGQCLFNVQAPSQDTLATLGQKIHGKVPFADKALPNSESLKSWRMLAVSGCSRLLPSACIWRLGGYILQQSLCP